MIKRLLLLAVIVMSSLMTQAQSAKEIELTALVNDVNIRNFYLDRVHQEGDVYHIYLVRDLESDEAMFGKVRLAALGATGLTIYGYAELQVDMSSMQVLSEKCYYVQTTKSGHEQPKDLWALNSEGKRSRMIVEADHVIMESDFEREFPNYEKAIPSDLGETVMTKAQFDELPGAYYENKIDYKGFANKVEGFKVVEYTKKPFEPNRKGFFSDLKEVFKSNYERDFRNIEWEGYNGGDKKNLWQKAYGKNFSDNVTGTVYAQHAWRSKDDKHSIYKHFEIVTFNKDGKLIKRLEKKYDAPKEFVYSGASYTGKDGKITGVNYVVGDMASLMIIGAKKKYGDYKNPKLKEFIRFDEAGQLVYEKEVELGEATTIYNNWQNAAGDDIFFSMRNETKAPVTITVTKDGELTEKEETGQASTSLQGLATGQLYRTHQAGKLTDIKGGGKTFITKTYKAGSQSTSSTAAYGHAYAPIYDGNGVLQQIVPFIRMDAQTPANSPIIRLEKDTDEYMIFAYRDQLLGEPGYGKFVKSVFVDKSNWKITESEIRDLGGFSTYANGNMYMTLGVGKEVSKLVVIK